MSQIFEVGKSYSCRSICDYDCIYTFRVLKRSAKTVTVDYHGEQTRRKVWVTDGVEKIAPHGSYSMSPVLSANKEAAL